ncbi:MAG: hypothetical protein CME88_06050 [Hirschia sp.]|nr:hypothetical protein [Hirschia sp.]MBF17923.1 hypothetical protein [Hirschia sp.]|tara:strand:- start:127 stop:618 length:492 start_codon:yes stop_codon:yes gene_type:complete
MKTYLAPAAILALSLFGALSSTPVEAQDADVQQVLQTEPLTIQSAGATHSFNIELADEAEERARGLMFRESMARDHGMLFTFEQQREPGMWMKNTLIPLDMLFIDENGIILAIAENTQPHSLRHVTPGMPVSGVLELNGGLTSELEIAPGDVVHHPFFGNVGE